MNDITRAPGATFLLATDPPIPKPKSNAGITYIKLDQTSELEIEVKSLSQ